MRHKWDTKIVFDYRSKEVQVNTIWWHLTDLLNCVRGPSLLLPLPMRPVSCIWFILAFSCRTVQFRMMVCVERSHVMKEYAIMRYGNVYHEIKRKEVSIIVPQINSYLQTQAGKLTHEQCDDHSRVTWALLCSRRIATSGIRYWESRDSRSKVSVPRLNMLLCCRS